MLVRHNNHHSQFTDKVDHVLPEGFLTRLKKCTIKKDDPEKQVYTLTATQEYQRGLAIDNKGNSVRLSDNQVCYCWPKGSIETAEFDNLEEARDLFVKSTGCQPTIMSDKKFVYKDLGDPFSYEDLDKRIKKDPELFYEMFRRTALVAYDGDTGKKVTGKQAVDFLRENDIFWEDIYLG